MAKADDIQYFGDLTDALDAHRQRMNGPYAAVYGFGEHQSQLSDCMYGGITQLFRDIADQTETLQQECERPCREKTNKQEREEDARKRSTAARDRLSDITMRNANVDTDAAAA